LYASAFDRSNLPMPPRREVAVVACMDARLDVYRLLGLDLGDAHVIRNAGGVVTEDVIRSLIISQRMQGTNEIVLIHHTDCGMLTIREEELVQGIEEETGVRPTFALEGFDSSEDGVRQSLARIDASPFLLHRAARGFIYDVDSGALREVARPAVRRPTSG
jgi:carbonic anhydrase